MLLANEFTPGQALQSKALRENEKTLLSCSFQRFGDLKAENKEEPAC